MTESHRGHLQRALDRAHAELEQAHNTIKELKEKNQRLREELACSPSSPEGMSQREALRSELIKELSKENSRLLEEQQKNE